MSNDTHLSRVAVGIPSQMKQFVVEVTQVDVYIVQVRLRHTSGFMLFVAVYSPTEMCGTKEKEVFHAKHDSIFYQKRPQDALIALGYFNAATGTERMNHVDPHPSGTRNTQQFLHNFTRS